MVWEHQTVLLVQQLVPTQLTLQTAHWIITVEFLFKEVYLLLFNTSRHKMSTMTRR
jgi:hypothetical protein